MPKILEVDNLVKKYGDFAAVKGVSFDVEEGEVFGLLGPNGAGKTQTISMLTGVIPPTEGTARVGGYDIRTEMSQVKRINGLVPQDLALYPMMSARANLNFFGRIYGLHGTALKERVDDVLHIVALADRADEVVEHFSGGMKRRVNIAAGLVHQPRLLFLDEPTVGVDPQSRNHIFESVLSLNKERGMSIVYTSHYMEEVELLCHRVAIMDRGEIIAMDTVKNLIGLLGGGVMTIGVPQADDQLLRDLTALPAVQQAVLDGADGSEPSGNGHEVPVGVVKDAHIRVVAHNSQQGVIGVISYLNEHDIPLTSLEILEPNLESVFLHLTGKKLRE